MNTFGLKNIVHVITILVVLAVIIGYSYLEMRGMLMGPRITIDSPTNGQTVSDPILVLSGVAENVRVISLNGREILIDEVGNFEEIHLLYPGHNTIVLRAQDRFDTEIEQRMQIIYTPIAV